MSQVMNGRAVPRIWGAVVQLDDGTVVTARNGLNLRVPPNSQVGVVKIGSRYSIIERPR